MPGAVVRVLYIDAQGRQHRARTIEVPNYNDLPTKILFGGGGRIEVVEARYSQGREPETWSRLVEPAR